MLSLMRTILEADLIFCHCIHAGVLILGDTFKIQFMSLERLNGEAKSQLI